MGRTRLFVYGDHLGDKAKALQKVYSLSRTSPVVKEFLQRATRTIKDQASELTPAERRDLGDSTDILDIAATFASSETPSEAASFALSVTAQVAELL